MIDGQRSGRVDRRVGEGIVGGDEVTCDPEGGERGEGGGWHRTRTVDWLSQ